MQLVVLQIDEKFPYESNQHKWVTLVRKLGMQNVKAFGDFDAQFVHVSGVVNNIIEFEERLKNSPLSQVSIML